MERTQLSASCGWGSEESGVQCQIWHKKEVKRFKPETVLDRSDECSEQTLQLLHKAELTPAPRFSFCFGETHDRCQQTHVFAELTSPKTN